MFGAANFKFEILHFYGHFCHTNIINNDQEIIDALVAGKICIRNTYNRIDNTFFKCS